MSSSDLLIDALLARRSASARHLIAPGPTDAELEKIVFVASRAPDHGRLVPFRYIVIGPEARSAFADVLAAATREMTPDIAESEIERAREKADQGPCLLAIIGRIDPGHPKIPASDQWLAVGCALENLLLTAQALGFGAAVRSGRYLDGNAVRQAFTLTDREHFLGFIAIGTATDWPPAKPKPEMTAVLSHWKP